MTPDDEQQFRARVRRLLAGAPDPDPETEREAERTPHDHADARQRVRGGSRRGGRSAARGE
jgi:hypothetical protein